MLNQPLTPDISPSASPEPSEQYPFDAQEVAAIYQKRFGISAPLKAIEAMAYWNLPNAQRAQICYDIGQLTQLLFDYLKDHPDFPDPPAGN